MAPPTDYAKIHYSAIREELDELDELEPLEPDSSSIRFSPKKHIFEDPFVAQYYKDLYEKSQYECRSYFDPDFTWEPEEEAKLVRKTDYLVTLLAFFLFFSLDIDRGNLSNALSNNMLNDLNLTTDDLNMGSIINLVCFLSAELPAQMLSKKFGPDISIPTQLSLWSIVAIYQMAIKSKTGFYVTRALIGLLQGSFIPNMCLWMSYFYTGKELPTRLSYFYIANPFTGAVSSLMAYFIFHLDGWKGLEGWRWLFCLEGAFTLLVGLWSFSKMVPSVVQTKTWYRPEGWYSYREEKIMVNRILRDDPNKGDMNNREGLTLEVLWKCLGDYDIWPIYIVRLMSDINVRPISRYLTLMLRDLGFDTLTTNLLTIPASLIGIFTMMAAAYLSEGINQRALVIMLGPLWCIPCLLVLCYWSGAQVEVWPTYLIIITALAHPVASVLTVTWASSNSNAVSTRAVSAAVVNMFSQTAGIVSAQIYRADDAPLYHRGNFQLLMIAIGSVGACIVSKIYYMSRNRTKEKIWLSMTIEQQQEYMKTTSDSGNKRLDFKFVH